ncbi:hypothetical protein PpBr36_03897 [Pyricularia pennisetigena]|uniref:hypothetical protein n=1 Tax=Pyricularia pennisetigena TaxID=1578925 RepID=UPI00114E2645|nr:hypothetical protein PpBr36_03897 [Pyricularia pennisetigena]TLS30813.1 hypothetical protein PpBr36_03897 [Pyricularia pennisetigena]
MSPYGNKALAMTIGLAIILSFSFVLLTDDACKSIPIENGHIHICETTPGVRSFSGHITIPPSEDSRVESNMFFMFFEARKSPREAPLTLWLQGGPGSGSIGQAVSGHSGPCRVTGPDGTATELNPWSWNNEANMLYVDQPVLTGYSYDTISRGFRNVTTGHIAVGDDAFAQIPADNATIRRGLFASQDAKNAPNTTDTAVAQLVRFLDIWTRDFARYPHDEINIWAQSYGGHFAPALAAALMARRRDRPELMSVGSVGIINGLVDLVLQAPSLTTFPVNNTYGIKAYSEDVAAQARSILPTCIAQSGECQALQRSKTKSRKEIDDTCAAAFGTCWGLAALYDANADRGFFDIGHQALDPFPPEYIVGWLNNDEVMRKIGARINYTETSGATENGFAMTGDFIRSSADELVGLIDAGVKVALVHGDRDFRCNWIGGEAVSLALNHSKKEQFAAAGYTDIKTNNTYVGGKVRQQGLFSFSRVFQAGHEVPMYQPETAYRIFMRTITGKDVATGTVDVVKDSGFATQGPWSVFNVQQPPPPHPPNECYIDYSPLGWRCTKEQIAALTNGTAVVENRVVVAPAA